MTIAELRRAHAHAVRMHKIHRTRAWERAVKRLCTEIMTRVRVARHEDEPSGRTLANRSAG